LEIIGEATKHLSESFRKSHPDVPWKMMAGMRDILIHAYHEADLNIIWKTVKEFLPDLLAKL